MVQLIVSLSGSAISISNVLVVSVHTLVLVFAGFGLLCVGGSFISTVNVSVSVSVLFTLSYVFASTV